MNSRLTIDYNIGPVKDRSMEGQYIFIVPEMDKEKTETHIKNALKKSIKKLDCDKEKVLIGVLKVFIDEQPYLKVSFLKIGSLFKSYSKKLS